MISPKRGTVVAPRTPIVRRVLSFRNVLANERYSTLHRYRTTRPVSQKCFALNKGTVPCIPIVPRVPSIRDVLPKERYSTLYPFRTRIVPQCLPD